MTALLAARRSSCTAVARTEPLRIIDPLRHDPLSDGDCQERTTSSAHLCPSFPKQSVAGGGGFHWI
jgi:hypothetical protein